MKTHAVQIIIRWRACFPKRDSKTAEFSCFSSKSGCLIWYFEVAWLIFRLIHFPGQFLSTAGPLRDSFSDSVRGQRVGENRKQSVVPCFLEISSRNA
jgi:hypothetical protein